MRWTDLYKTADSEPLATALRKICEIVDRSESDAEQMVEMLNEIDDVIAAARAAWLANVQAEQKRILEELRSQ